MQQLREWLHDAIRMGTAELLQQPDDFWEMQKSRLVDAQAGGIANYFMEIREAFHLPNWQHEVLDHLGILNLMTSGFEQFDSLSPDFQTELLLLAGVSIKKKTLIEQEGTKDTWQVLGKRIEIQERLDVQRTWLKGIASGKTALILEFAFGSQGFETFWEAGQEITAELVFFPGSYPLRAIAKPTFDPPVIMENLPASHSFSKCLDEYANALGLQPFLFQFPMNITALKPHYHGGKFILYTPENQVIPLSPSFQKSWELMAISGGNFIPVFGEWDGKQFLPLATKTALKWMSL